MLRNATTDDIDYIINIHDVAADEGHFMCVKTLGMNQLIDAVALGFKTSLQVSIKKHQRPLMDGTLISAALLVYEFNKKPIGFAYLSDVPPDIEFLPVLKKSKEIYMMCIEKDFQNQGHGKEMLKQILERVSRFETLLARVYETSIPMMKLLRIYGFHDFGSRSKGPRIFLQSKTADMDKIKKALDKYEKG